MINNLKNINLDGTLRDLYMALNICCMWRYIWHLICNKSFLCPWNPCEFLLLHKCTYVENVYALIRRVALFFSADNLLMLSVELVSLTTDNWGLLWKPFIELTESNLVLTGGWWLSQYDTWVLCIVALLLSGFSSFLHLKAVKNAVLNFLLMKQYLYEQKRIKGM